MARSFSTILSSIIGKVAPGWALGYRDGLLDVVLASVAERVGDAEIGAEALMAETDPRSAVNLLSDFERVLGPDPCGRDLDPLSIGDRQRLAHQRWTATGGQSIPYMISVAEKLGVSITIEEFWPSKSGGLRAGQRLRPDGSQFVYRVNIPGLITVVKFRAGVSVAGDRLGNFKISNIECELRRIRPGHTDIVFQYGA